MDGADTERHAPTARTPQGVEQAFVMAEEEKIDAADCDCRESDSCAFARNRGQQGAYECEEQNQQSQDVDSSVSQMLRIPERQRDEHTRHGRNAADADQQEIVVHYDISGCQSLGISEWELWNRDIKNVGQNSDLLSEALE